MGNDEFSSFNSLSALIPNPSFDSILHDFFYASSLPSISYETASSSPWMARAFGVDSFSSASASTTKLTPKPPVRKYKPVHRKHRPVPTYFLNPEAQQFKPIPPPTPLQLPIHPPRWQDLKFGIRVTKERLGDMIANIDMSVFSQEEVDLIAWVVVQRESAFAFDFTEKGFFSREYYPDYKIPTIEHVPWQVPPIPIPWAIRDEVQQEVLTQEKAGRFEPTTSSYRSPLFAVKKKKGIRLVINLEKLNSVTCQDASLPPNVHEFAEEHVGYSIYGLFDLFSGFDARWVHVRSRPLQAFTSPAGAKQQCTLVQGYTNSVQEFQRCVEHALDTVREIAKNFLDDCTLRGPPDRYNNETIPGNSKIRRFVFEYAENLALLLGALINAGITASGAKAILMALRLKVVGTMVAYEGWILDPGLVDKVVNWKEPGNVQEVRQFLGVAGVGRRWIKGYAIIAKPLTILLHKTITVDNSFIFTGEAAEAMKMLIERITSPPVLIKLDYNEAVKVLRSNRTTDEGLVVVGVDSSWIGAGWAVYQIHQGRKHPAIYGSCTFNEREQNYGQPKTEVYGIFRALKELRHRVWGVHFRLDHDAKSLLQMLRQPDELPNAPLLRWVSWIRLFDFEMNHVPADSHKLEDALSRRPPAPTDQPSEENPEDIERFIESFLNVMVHSETISAKYLLDSLHAKLTISAQSVWSGAEIPFFHAGEAMSIEDDMIESSFASAAITHYTSAATVEYESRSLPDFKVCTSLAKQSDMFLFGGEEVLFEFTTYNHYEELAYGFTGHKFGIADRDGADHWMEIRVYLEKGEVPNRCANVRDHLKFKKMAYQFFLHDNRLWFGTRKSTRLPRLVIESPERRGSC